MKRAEDALSAARQRRSTRKKHKRKKAERKESQTMTERKEQ